MSSDDFIGGLRRGSLPGDKFVLVTNTLARDKRLSYKAKGIYLNLASHREGYEISIKQLAAQGTDSKHSITAGIKELAECGYVYRGPRKRYPAGTVDSHGRPIGGLLGPYTWWVTDDPDEIDQILKQVAKERADDGAEDDEVA